MFERFTVAARTAVTHAQQVARDLRHPSIAAGHILLSLATEVQGVAGDVLAQRGFDAEAAANALRAALVGPSDFLDDTDEHALRAIGIDLDGVRRAIDDSFGPGALARAQERWIRRGHIRFTAEAKKALELSLREALRLGHRYIGSEHVLLGLVRDDRNSACLVLRRQGIDPLEVRKAVVAAMQVERRRGSTG